MKIIRTPEYIKYKGHKGDALRRKDFYGNPIQWNLTFEQWMEVWQQSGHWEERGCKKGQYCMSRYNDIGPYEIDNVFIQLHSDNIRQARLSKPLSSEVYAQIAEKNKGKKRSEDFRDRLSITRQGKDNPNHSSKKHKDMEIL